MSSAGVGTGARPAVGRLGRLLTRFAFVGAFAVLFAIFAIASSNFLSPGNLSNVVEGSVVLLLVALAMTLVVASGGIDLSVAVAVDFGAWFSLAAMLNFDAPWPLAILAGLAGGAVVGLLNSFLIVRLGVTPFLATLGTLFIGRSVQQIGTGGGGNVNFRAAPDEFRWFAQGEFFGIPVDVIVGAVVLVIYFIILERSVHGVRIHAMGMQDAAARVAGLRTNRYRVAVYVAAGITAAVGGVLLSAGLRIFTPLAGFAYLLNAIAAVFIGASMHPRQRPNVPGTLVGVLFLGVLANGLDLMGLDFNVKAALQGIVLVIALASAAVVSRLSSES
ncbi:MAG: ABC transporter permease [Chloroflexota bacterium]|jgi:ribose transport system permease protein